MESYIQLYMPRHLSDELCLPVNPQVELHLSSGFQTTKTSFIAKARVTTARTVFGSYNFLPHSNFFGSHTILLVRGNRKVYLKEHYEIFNKARPQPSIFFYRN